MAYDLSTFRWFTHFYMFAAPFATLTLYASFAHEAALRNVIQFLLGSEDIPCVPSKSAGSLVQ